MPTIDGTVYVRRGDLWVPTVSSGGGGGPGGTLELLETFTFPGGDTTGWTEGGDHSWSESPTDWVTASGNGTGATFLRRLQPEGTTYVEVDTYTDAFSENWIAVRPWDPTGIALYDDGGPGWLMRGDGVLAAVWGGGSDVEAAGHLTGGERLGTTVDNAGTIGVYVEAGMSEVYVDGVLRWTRTGQNDYSANDYLTIGCYNGISGHFNEVRCYSGHP